MVKNNKMYEYESLLVIDEVTDIQSVIDKVNQLKKANLDGYKYNVKYCTDYYAEKTEMEIKDLEEETEKIDVPYPEIVENEPKESREEKIKTIKEWNEECLKSSINSEEREYKKVLSKKFDLLFDLSLIGKTKESLSFIGQVLTVFNKKSIGFDNVSFQLLSNDADISERMPTILTSDEFSLVKDFERDLKENGLVKNIKLQEGFGGNSFTINQVEKANNIIDAVVNKIMKLNLSPFETAVYIHDFCSSFYYNSYDLDLGSRTLADVVNSGNIVCVGYASMFKAIVDKLNIPEIKAGLNFANSVDNAGGHANNLVYIKDEKYGIDGYYMEDSCWDNPKMIEKDSSLTYCLYPINDIDYVRTNYKYSANGDMQIYYGIKVKGDLIDDSDQDERKIRLNKEHREFLASIDKIGSPIQIEKYAEAYYEILVKQGADKEKAKKTTEEKINNSIAVANYNIDKGSSNSFNKDVSEEFLEKYIDKITLLEARLEYLENEKDRIFELASDEYFKYSSDLQKIDEEYWLIHDKLTDLRTQKESIGNKINRLRFEDILKEL